MSRGRIEKALSGFYYVRTPEGLLQCRARGKFRREGISPLVGDWVQVRDLGGDEGFVEAIEPRQNRFARPAAANIDQLVIIASQAIPVTDPFLIDRVVAIAQSRDCPCVICVNKCDLEPGDDLAAIYTAAGFPTLKVSAQTGEGMDQLRSLIAGKVSAFTGNSGVGKSSILNALDDQVDLATGDVSEKLGRGRHTTRHVELFRLGCGAVVADTPGFSSFDVDRMELMRKEELARCFPEFAPYVDQCQFQDCAHVKEKGCAVLAALKRGEIQPTRHASYVRLYEQAKAIPDWERK